MKTPVVVNFPLEKQMPISRKGSFRSKKKILEVKNILGRWIRIAESNHLRNDGKGEV